MFIPKVFTSYYANWRRFPETATPISIAGNAPEGFLGLEYKKLAPKWSFFKDYKDGIIDEEGYTIQYNKLILEPLSPKVVFEELTKDLGTDIILLCWEKKGSFCHRHIVAKWLMNNLNFMVYELVNKG